MTEADLPLVSEWLAEAHLQRWWRDPGAPAGVEDKYLPRLRGDEPTEMFTIVWRQEPVGFVQRYLLRDHPDWRRTLEDATGSPFEDAAGIDYAIGRPDLIGRGIGGLVVASFSRRLFDDLPETDRIVVTPQAENVASCRVLEKAGYELRWKGMLDSDDPGDAGPAALYVLERSAMPTTSEAVRRTHDWFEHHSGWAPPDVDTLDEWLADGVCRAPDECLVTPDGWCEHGLASWNLVLAALA
jgi:aminoglycoside 6'-N-acetyltransferase